ncbi:hypothetical protein LXL04_020316 [Taraxacum kok-saghyz]
MKDLIKYPPIKTVVKHPYVAWSKPSILQIPIRKYNSRDSRLTTRTPEPTTNPVVANGYEAAKKGEEDAYLTGGERRAKVIWCFISIKPLKSIIWKPSKIDYRFKLLLFYSISVLNSKAVTAPPLDDVLLLFWIDIKGDHSPRIE